MTSSLNGIIPQSEKNNSALSLSSYFDTSINNRLNAWDAQEVMKVLLTNTEEFVGKVSEEMTSNGKEPHQAEKCSPSPPLTNGYRFPHKRDEDNKTVGKQDLKRPHKNKDILSLKRSAKKQSSSFSSEDKKRAKVMLFQESEQVFLPTLSKTIERRKKMSKHVYNLARYLQKTNSSTNTKTVSTAPSQSVIEVSLPILPTVGTTEQSLTHPCNDTHSTSAAPHEVTISNDVNNTLSLNHLVSEYSESTITSTPTIPATSQENDSSSRGTNGEIIDLTDDDIGLMNAHEQMPPPPAYPNIACEKINTTSGSQSKCPKLELIVRSISDSGIKISWVNSSNIPTTSISQYQLYVCDVDIQSDDSPWKRIGTVKPLPLPMACTITSLTHGRYYLAIRAKDSTGHYGEFSDPQSLIYS